MTLLRKQFPSAVDLEDLPFFPTKSGAVVSKDGFAKWVVRLAVACEAARTEDPASEFAGHVWRICGSRHMYRMRVPIPIIKLLARWASNVIVRYLHEVPLEDLTSIYKGELSPPALSCGSSSSAGTAMICDISAAQVTAIGKRGIDAQVQAAVEAAIEPLNAQLNKLAGMVESAEMAAKACRREVEDLERRQRMPYVYRLTGRNRTYHVVAGDYALVPPRIWCTRCGWNYGSALFERFASIPVDTPASALCKRCLPLQALEGLGIQIEDAAKYGSDSSQE